MIKMTSAIKRLAMASVPAPLTFVFAVALISFQVAAVSASPSLAVGLISFSGTPLDGAVRLEWETGTEQNTAGFKIQRTSGSETVLLAPPDLTALNSEQIDPFPPEGYAFIWSKGSPASGATYIVQDNSVSNGVEYTYRLIEIESDSNELEVASLTVTAGIPTATPTSTPVIISGNPADGLPGGSSTSAAPPPTRTPRPTETPPRATLTASPSSTPVSSQTLAGTTATPTSTATMPAPDGGPAVDSAALRPAASTPQAMQSDSPELDETVSLSEGDASVVVQIAEAQTEPETTTPAGYPGPGETTLEENGDGLAPLAVPDSPEASPYPAAETDDRSTPMAVIGGQSNLEQPPATSDDADSRVWLGRIYLWGAFVIASLVFITAVVGSIILFTRKRS